MNDKSYLIIRKAENITAKWAGGTTTQLFIYPPEATYQQFNFIFRISFATVEVEESTFTFMPGVTRHLMILDGKLEIDHVDKYKKTLNKFDTDTFSGEWPTKAKGKVKDFNLMTKGNATGELNHLSLSKGEMVGFPVKDSAYCGFFLLSGEININQMVYLKSGDLFLITERFSEVLFISAKENSEIIISYVDWKMKAI